jgi:DNA-binding response OmpR family regulator
MGSKEDTVRILFIEDDHAMAEMYKVRLQADGYAVEVEPDGEAAVQAAMDHPPDIVFLDVRQPSLDRLAVLERLRGHERTRTLPVVILSNHSQGELMGRGWKLGANSYLVKLPTSPAEVSYNVPHWLR